MDEQSFLASTLVIDAVQRNFMVVGEAASQVPSEVTDAHPEIPWRKMRDMRNVLIHVYWSVDAGLVWNTVQQDLPPLIPLLEHVLAELSE